MSTDRDNTPEAGDAENVNRARRRLLKVAVYVPPAVVGALSLADAGCQPQSCGPQNCQPNGAPCGPDGCPPRA